MANSKLYHCAILLGCVVLTAGAWCFSVDDIGVKLFGFKWHMHCLLYHHFGVKCAFCGMSRSFVSTAHGRFAQGFQYHPIGPILYCWLLIQIPYRATAAWISPKKIPSKISKINGTIFALILTAIVFNWIIYLAMKQ